MAELLDSTSLYPKAEIFLAGHTLLSLQTTLEHPQATRNYKTEAEILPILFNLLTLLFHLFAAWKLMKEDHARVKNEEKNNL